MNKEALIDEIAFIVEGVDVIGPSKTAEEIIKHLKNNGILNKESKADNMKVAIIDTETTGLNPMENRLVAIGIGRIHDDGVIEKVIFMDDDEKQMLDEFWSWINGVDKIVGFNTDFDWQFLKLRSLYHRIKVKHFKKYSGRIDLREILNGSNGRYQKGTRLVDYCRFFDIDVAEDDFKGASVPELWSRYEEGDESARAEIRKHLDYDIDRTLELYKILVECGLIEG
jgi:uncharacterized protein YprB with RNaseH-like and TPR domain